MSELSAVFEHGGAVSVALVIVSLLLWTAVWLRLAALRRASTLSPPKDSRGLTRAIESLAVWKSPIRTLVIVAPLLGLLGTVGGMVELFDSLHAGGSVREGSVAGGISHALVTTQLGLVIGAPGLVASRLLNRREVRLQEALRRQGATR